ncbi:MAG TPA: type II toxin-antitoxin system VapC family toxin, partial [Planctomycetota bacterium]|nr:type II toxin-antitoxin system VapC family toxin [Planctomycetota bacterium]
MKFVLDASLALSWCFEDERTPFTEAALRALPRLGAAAPFLWCYEVSNGLRTAQKSGRIPSEESATAILEDLDALPIELIYQPPGATLVDARRLALQQNLSVYDASYLVLA